METFSLYLIKSTVWLTGFLLIYMLFLRNERFFVLNRIYLVFGILASILLPLFTWHYTVIFPVTPTVEALEPQIMGTTIVPEPFPIQKMLLYFYLAGASYLLFSLIKQTVSVWKVIRQSETYRFNSVKLIRTDRYPASFSFFSFIFVNPSIDEPETSEIVKHEQEHVRQQHWMDLLLFEILRTMHWFNPVSWLYGRLIRQNHEYLADERALQRTSNPAIYRAALLNQMFGGPVISLSNSFNYSINKKRFKMMTKTIHSPFRKLKLLLAFPLIASVFYAFAAPEYQFVPVENKSVTTEATPTSSEILADQINALLAQTSENETNSLQSQPNNSVSTSLITDGKTIKGRVITEDGKPLPGTSIIISGTSDGTMPDANGYFELKSANDSPIVFSFVGYQSVKVQPDFEKEMLITMKREIISIDIAGNNTSGAQTTPGLVIVDGKEIPNTDLGTVDPNSIESISVLKNESATSLYGERAKNGVVLVTLKKGQTSENKSTVAAPKFAIGYPALPTGSNSNAGVVIRNDQFMPGVKPLIIIDGVVSDKQKIEEINPNTIKSVSVLKGESATNLYGERAKSGVLLVTLKNAQTSNDQSTSAAKPFLIGQPMFQSVPQSNGGIVVRGTGTTMSGAKPLYVIDGVVSEIQNVENINPNTIQSINVVKNETATQKYGEKAKDGVVEITLKKGVTSDQTSNSEVKVTGYALPPGEEVFMVVEEMPEFPGGTLALRQYLADALKYPVIAQQNGIQGKVYVNFVINKDGSVSDARIARGVDPSLDAEALRVVSLLPKWTPGKQRGVPVRVSYTVPINFQLDSNQTNTAASAEKTSSEEEVFVVVEEMPEFPGGTAALRQYLADALKYPVIAQQNGVQGRVYVKFVVNKDGSVSDAQIARGVESSLDAEALRVVSSLPKWIPGKQRGEPVRVSYTVPINFQLQPAQTSATVNAGNSTPEKEVFIVVEEMPVFKGVIEALRVYVASALKYPAIAIANGISGQVFVQFVVSKTGKVTDAKVAKGVDPSLDKEALRIVNSMPDWIPGTQRGRAVDVSFSMPISFSLPEGTPSNAERAGIHATNTNKKLIIVPNPANNQATITADGMSEPAKLEVSIIDKYGKPVKTEQKTGPTFTLNISNLVTGTYFILATDGKDKYAGNLIILH